MAALELCPQARNGRLGLGSKSGRSGPVSPNRSDDRNLRLKCRATIAWVAILGQKEQACPASRRAPWSQLKPSRLQRPGCVSPNDPVCVDIKMPPFDPKTFLATVGAGISRITLRARQIVFSQGDPADAVFYIEDGKIELKVVSPHGKEAVLAILGFGEFVGEGALAGQPLRMATASAATDCSVMRIEKSAVIEVLSSEAAFSALFVSYLLTRNIRIERKSRRSVIQFERKAPGAASLAVGQCRKRTEAGAGYPQGQPGDLARDDRHYPVARKFLREQIPQARLHRVQRRPERQSLAADRDLARLKDKSFLSLSSCPPVRFCRS